MITRHSERLRVRHAPSDVFELVSDVERYPEFIPYLTTLRILAQETRGESRVFVAEAVARYRIARERFVTRVVADPTALRVSVNLVEGPFHVLRNVWQMSEREDGSTAIDFELEFQFNNMVLDMLVRANKQRAVQMMIGLFVSEADRRYPVVGNAG
ncbi:type II toxin-antitoxin system RatA family toxin [Hyphobacterium sp. CCMP332]|uniref:type II toxin-antitoxin system RatA family toxin n=1 Tax=Hyphobacterium sp. CCMP332 TaxID=2749086 RepID=UPI00164FF48C|nr:type II toxin-antitoxin system RatA family toxin [Hyphobacterium sp. CCMP332]QNL18708.1 type II toxin-antitoxin system RatA family toxin [Hyphobacterium sp. CCMP332]